MLPAMLGRVTETGPHANALGMFGVIDGQSEAYVLIAGGFIDAGGLAAGKMRTAGPRSVGGQADTWVTRSITSMRTGLSALSDPRLRWTPLAKIALEPILGQAALHPPPVAVGDPRARLLTAELLAARSREEELRAELVRLQTAVHAGSEATAHIAALQDMLANEQRLREAAEQAADTVVRQPLSVPSGRIADEVHDVLAFLLPNVSMLRDSIKVITLEFATRRGVWRALGELASAKGIPRDWKKIRGADAWWERHLSDGRDDTGRIYARRAAGSAWEVLISHKTEQGRDIAWLCRQ